MINFFQVYNKCVKIIIKEISFVEDNHYLQKSKLINRFSIYKLDKI